MNHRFSKVMSLTEAVSTFVVPGCHLSIGGFTTSRNPMAAVYEIIRQRIDHIHLYAHSNGQGVDELVGAGCVGRIEIAYAGSGRFAPTCIRFRKAVENRSIQIEDYSNYHMTLRFLAGAMGVPFLPTRSGLGTDIVRKWGFSAEMRKSDPRVPDDKLLVVDNPFGTWGNAEKLVLVPAIHTDVAIIHVQKADIQGTARIEGLTFSDVEQFKAAEHVIVTCEELITDDSLKAGPDGNQVPHFCVSAVVHVPYGAYPTACYHHYDYDPKYLNAYRKAAQDDERYAEYLERFIYGVKDHRELLALQNEADLNAIRADARTGYAVGLDRR